MGISIIITFFVFIIDLQTPLGIATGVLYIFSLIFLTDKSKLVIAIFALVSIFLLLLKLSIFQIPDTPSYVYINRTISIFTVVTVALIKINLNNKRKHILELNKNLRLQNSDLKYISKVYSHDINEPIRNILGFISLIDDEGIRKDNAIYTYLIDNVNKLKESLIIFNQYINISNKITIKKIKLKEFIDKEILSVYPMCEEISYLNNVSEKITLKCDKSILKKVFLILIDNSIKYKKPNCKAHIAIYSDFIDKKFSLSYIDNSIGINYQQKEKVFDLFYRYDIFSKPSSGLATARKYLSFVDAEIKFDIEYTEGIMALITFNK